MQKVVVIDRRVDPVGEGRVAIESFSQLLSLVAQKFPRRVITTQNEGIAWVWGTEEKSVEFCYILTDYIKKCHSENTIGKLIPPIGRIRACDLPEESDDKPFMYQQSQPISQDLLNWDIPLQ